MKSFQFLAIVTLTILITLSCKEEITNPTEPAAGRRDYVWTADTLKLPIGEFINISSIWGSDPNNIWVTGGATSNQYRLWRYINGKWNNVDIGFSLMDPRRLFGFSYNNIWLGTAFGILAHYDGLKWTSSGDLSPTGETLVIQGIWGTSSDNLYAFGFLDKLDRTGYKGCILKFNGIKWNYLKIENLSINFLTMGYDIEAEKYFLHAYQSETGYQYIYELTGDKLRKVYESKEETKVFNLNNRVYFMVGKKIYKCNKNGELYVWNDFESVSIYAGILEGRSEKDIFTINWGGIGHYNGEDVAWLYKTDLWFKGSIVFEKEIIIACKNYQNGVSVIVRGKLKN